METSINEKGGRVMPRYLGRPGLSAEFRRTITGRVVRRPTVRELADIRPVELCQCSSCRGSILK